MGAMEDGPAMGWSAGRAVGGPVSQEVLGSQRSADVVSCGMVGVPGVPAAEESRVRLELSWASMTAAVRIRSEYSSRERTREDD